MTLDIARAGALARIEGPEKVTGRATYAFEYDVPGDVLYCWAVQSSCPAGRIVTVDRSAALSDAAVVAVLAYDNAPRLCDVGDGELAVLQSDRVAYRGQIVAGVLATDLEAAREAASKVIVRIEPEASDTTFRADHPRRYQPDKVNPDFPSDTSSGDLESALEHAAVCVDVTYRTPAFHNNPMEPHASIARFHPDGRLQLFDSNQGPAVARDTLARLFGLPVESVEVISPHVGGGFGSKGTPRPGVVLVALGAKLTGRTVKGATSRQQMFDFTGYRTPTVQRVRLGATRDGRLVAIGHDVVEQTSMVKEFAEQAAVATRTMYAAPARATSHRLVALNVPTPSWMRAPGECPGMYALESAIDELAHSLSMDPVELRIRNEPSVDPESGLAFSSRNLVACLTEGARRFGWSALMSAPRPRERERVGYGVASSTYPARTVPATARARRIGDRFDVEIAASDIGTGSRTALTVLAAEALHVAPEAVHVVLGHGSLPDAPLAGGSWGTSSWGSAVAGACRLLASRIERGDSGELEVTYNTEEELAARSKTARHAFGAQFVEVRVDAVTGEVRVPRMVGVFAAGRIVNAVTARSQFVGGMIMGLSMACCEESLFDPALGMFMNRDLADYHVASAADVGEIEVAWVDEHDEEVNALGTKGIGEIGIVGTAAAIGNAVAMATGHRLRELPLTPPRVLAALSS